MRKTRRDPLRKLDLGHVPSETSDRAHRLGVTPPVIAGEHPSATPADRQRCVKTPDAPPVVDPLPEQAPELWAARDLNRRETPADFVWRVYGRWLGSRDFARRNIAHLDPALYAVFNNWLRRNPGHPIGRLLPTRTSLVDELLAELAQHHSDDILQSLANAIEVRLRRQARAKSAAAGPDAEPDETMDISFDPSLTDEQLRERLRDLVTAAPADRLPGLAAQFRSAVTTAPAGVTPARPEDTFAARQDRSVGPVEFIRQRYGHLLDGSFTRADLRRIDLSAMKALHNHEFQAKARVSLVELNLPTVKERNDSLLAQIDAEPDPARRRWLKGLRANRAFTAKQGIK